MQNNQKCSSVAGCRMLIEKNDFLLTLQFPSDALIQQTLFNFD